MNKRQNRVKKVVAEIKDYWVKYATQPAYEDYTDSIIIEDALYGLGIALDPEKYQEAVGYARFKVRLKAYLEQEDAIAEQKAQAVEQAIALVTDGIPGCTNHSCLINPPVGMGTNGGCNCERKIFLLWQRLKQVPRRFRKGQVDDG